MKNKIFGSLLFLFGGLVVLTPRYILPVCEFSGYERMFCSDMGRAEMFIGFIVLSIAVGAFFSKSAETLRWLMFSAFASGLSVLLIPEFLRYCGSPRMPCNYGTVPMLRLMGGIIIIQSAVGFLMSLKVKKGG